MNSIRINFDQIEWDNKSAGMLVKRVLRNGKQLRLVEIGPDAGEANWCEEGHVGYILEGELETNINGSVERMSAGDGLFIPGGRQYRHKSKAIGGRVRLFLFEEV
ncbi:MAG: cupin domain-containing protein [Ignavibacteriaceae bacterium]